MAKCIRHNGTSNYENQIRRFFVEERSRLFSAKYYDEEHENTGNNPVPVTEDACLDFMMVNLKILNRKWKDTNQKEEAHSKLNF